MTGENYWRDYPLRILIIQNIYVEILFWQGICWLEDRLRFLKGLKKQQNPLGALIYLMLRLRPVILKDYSKFYFYEE